MWETGLWGLGRMARVEAIDRSLAGWEVSSSHLEISAHKVLLIDGLRNHFKQFSKTILIGGSAGFGRRHHRATVSPDLSSSESSPRGERDLDPAGAG
jgi:hypothetical protein